MPGVQTGALPICAIALHYVSGGANDLLRLLHGHDVADAHLLDREGHERDRDLVAAPRDHDFAEGANRESAVILADGVLRLRRQRVAAADHLHAISDLDARVLAEIHEHDLALADELILREQRDDRALRVDIRRHRRDVLEIFDERADLRAALDLLIRVDDDGACALVLLDADDLDRAEDLHVRADVLAAVLHLVVGLVDRVALANLRRIVRRVAQIDRITDRQELLLVDGAVDRDRLVEVALLDERPLLQAD